MHFFKQAGSPFWFVSFTDNVTGKRIKRSTKSETMRAARVAAAQIISRHEGAGGEEIGQGHGITIKDTLERYVSWLKMERKTSHRQSEQLARKTLGVGHGHRFSLDGARPLATLTPSDLDRLVRARRDEGNSAQTAAHEVKNLRAAANYVADLGATYPAAMVARGGRANPWRMPTLKSKTRYLTKEEWQAVYDRLNPEAPIKATYRNGVTHTLATSDMTARARRDIRDLFVILTMTGGRWAEVAKLTWDRVDTGSFAFVRLWGGKTNRERIAPLPEMAREIMRVRFAARRSIGVFPSSDGKGFRGQASARTIVQAMDASGLNRPDIVEMHGRATVHSLRHTYASWLLQGGADLSEVQEGLGHTTLDMTRRYAHLSQSRTAKRIVSVFDSMETTEL